MSRTKPGLVLGERHLEASSRGVKTTNAAGFDHRNLGHDTVPGPAVGAPLMNSRTVDDGTVRATNFSDGVNPYGLNSPRHMTPGTAGLGDHAPGRDSPVSPMAQRPHPDIATKAAEVSLADPDAGLNAHPTGTLSR
jgi:hypothetical protein